ncbi:GPI-anchored surface protein, putative, partial [Bodo saltans]
SASPLHVAFPRELHLLFESLLDVNCSSTLSDIIASLSNHPQCIPWSRLGAWLRSKADECPTLTEALQKLVDLETEDLPRARQELERDLRDLKRDSATILQSVNALKGVSDDYRAIYLYTCNSPVYKLVNALLTSSCNGEDFDAAPVKALFKMMYRGACHPRALVGPIRAYRFVACNSSWTKFQLQNYAVFFAVGTIITTYQFESYTLADDLPYFNAPDTPRIVYRCNKLMGFDVSHFSSTPAEKEVLVLPLARFEVKSVTRHNFPNGVLEYVEVEVDFLGCNMLW